MTAFGKCRITLPVFGSVPTGSGAKNAPRNVNPIVTEGLNREVGNGPSRAVSGMRKGQQWRVKAMQELIEFYEMVSLNGAALRGSEKTAILKARLALSIFERAMKSFKTSTAAPSVASFKRASTGAPFVAGGWFGMAA